MTAITTGDGPVLRIASSEPAPELEEAASGVDVPVATVGSTGVLAVEPLVAATADGRTAYYVDPSAEKVADAAAALADGSVGTNGADAVVDHNPEAARLPAPSLGALDVGSQRVLGGAGWRRPADADDHRAAGGFVDVDPETVLERAESLRGRGWGDWQRDAPLADAWRTAEAADGDAVVVVNGHGNPADALLLSSVPLDLLEGAQAAARAVGADRIDVYGSTADEQALSRVREAAENFPDPAAPVDVVAGPDDYRAAEPTMALEAIEGADRLEARLRPPGPEEVGLDGRPTLVHTARTYAHLAVALREGTPTESRVVTVTGDVDAPATVELRPDDHLAAAVAAVDVDGEFKAACVGGQFGGLTSSLDVPAAPDALADAGLGTEGTVEVLSEDRCVVEFVGQRARFAAEENCGRCVPCREGTTQLATLLREIYDGAYDPDPFEELSRVMGTSSICEFGVAAGRPARTAMDAFGGEFAAHAEGRCPAEACFDAPEVSH